MALLPRFRSCARALAATLLLSAALVRPAAAVDWTDIWWAVPEVGWGVNFVQSDQFIFATFYLHDVNLQPDWYTGQMTVDANGVWSGPLYRTTGSYFGASWNKDQTNTLQVGTATFTPSYVLRAGTLTWQRRARSNVTKQITAADADDDPSWAALYRGGAVHVAQQLQQPQSTTESGRLFVDVRRPTQTTGRPRCRSSSASTVDRLASCLFAGNYVYTDGSCTAFRTLPTRAATGVYNRRPT